MEILGTRLRKCNCCADTRFAMVWTSVFDVDWIGLGFDFKFEKPARHVKKKGLYAAGAYPWKQQSHSAIPLQSILQLQSIRSEFDFISKTRLTRAYIFVLVWTSAWSSHHFLLLEHLYLQTPVKYQFAPSCYWWATWICSWHPKCHLRQTLHCLALI